MERESQPGAPRWLGKTLAKKYEIEALLGRGAMGEVYRARDGEQRVALKVMLPKVAENPENVARLRREAQASTLLVHPNVIRVYELGEDKEQKALFLAMEMLDGQPLDRWLELLPEPPPLAAVKNLLVPVLNALELAHDKGVIHRDLKPANIFLSKTEQKFSVKVLDFGLARLTSTPGNTLTHTDMVAGTPQYMSPEQCQSLKDVGPATDLYALGCILTEMLQKESPFQASTPMEVISRQMFMPPPPLRRPAGLDPVPSALEALRLSLLAKEPRDRPSVAEARAQLIGAFEKGGATPIVSAPLTPVAVARLVGTEDGVSARCLTALGALGVAVDQVSSLRKLPREGLRAVILDAGSLVAEATSFVQHMRQVAPQVRLIVCLDDPSAEQVARLSADAHVVVYPVAAESLARRLQGLLAAPGGRPHESASMRSSGTLARSRSDSSISMRGVRSRSAR